MSRQGFVPALGADLAYELWDGEGDGELILLHGGGHNLRVWDGMLPTFRECGRVVLLDLRGHGWSSGSGDQSLRTHAEDLGAALAGLELRSPVIVAHSFGASVALTWAANGGDAGAVVLLDALVEDMSVTYARSMAQMLGEVEQLVRFDGTPAEAEVELARRLLSEPPGERDAWAAVFRRSLRAEGERLSEVPRTPELAGLVRAQFGLRPGPLYERLRVPTLLLLASTGEAQPVGADEAVRHSAVSRLSACGAPLTVNWIESDHNIPVARPEAAQQIAAWLRGVQPTIASSGGPV